MARVNKSLLGKDVSNLNDFALTVNESLLHDFNMGYVDGRTLTPFSSAGYYEVESSFRHPWEISELGRVYTFLKLKDVIPLKEFLDLPKFIIDDLIDGMSKGMTERDALEKQRLSKEENNTNKLMQDLSDIKKMLGE